MKLLFRNAKLATCGTNRKDATDEETDQQARELRE